MSIYLRRAGLPLGLALLLAGQATAQAAPAPAPASASSPADSMQAATPAPSLKYCSVFDSYRRFAEQPVESWQKVNQAVHQAGGWRALAKEARQADPAMAKPVDPACPPGIAPVLPDSAQSGTMPAAKPEVKPGAKP